MRCNGSLGNNFWAKKTWENDQHVQSLDDKFLKLPTGAMWKSPVEAAHRQLQNLSFKWTRWDTLMIEEKADCWK